MFKIWERGNMKIIFFRKSLFIRYNVKLINKVQQIYIQSWWSFSKGQTEDIYTWIAELDFDQENKNTKRFSEKGLFLRYSLDPTQAVLLLRDYKN